MKIAKARNRISYDMIHSNNFPVGPVATSIWAKGKRCVGLLTLLTFFIGLTVDATPTPSCTPSDGEWMAEAQRDFIVQDFAMRCQSWKRLPRPATRSP